LEELDLVRRVHRDGRCHGYLPASPGHRHAILCRRCGRATEFAGSDDLEGLIARVQHETGYRVEDHLLQLVGTCPVCQAAR
jgi:Fe2+ or Zn2+ uptake regulation protein